MKSIKGVQLSQRKNNIIFKIRKKLLFTKSKLFELDRQVFVFFSVYSFFYIVLTFCPIAQQIFEIIMYSRMVYLLKDRQILL